MKIFALLAAASAIAVNNAADPLNEVEVELDLPTAAEVMKTCDRNKNGRISYWEAKRCLKSAVK